ncbi:MAG: proline--tRNA ligase [Sedimentisphaerales bacterium]|nr:proline--tRNA ligase [Sedimentisphaerales bacterium]
MRYSRTFIPTVKETPADAETASHKLMIRAGLIRKVSSGTYTYLPLGLRSLLKVIAIVREEMNKAGAQEILVPSLQPKELWDKTGRSTDYGPTMFCLEDRHGRMNVLGPTAEEVFTSMVAGEIKSYKQLPINLYQISSKFRDEFRPRFGVIRSREFIMKDAYSFDTDPECLDKSYKAMYNAYCNVFRRCGLEYVIVEAESGEMGGSGSHQFTIPVESGEDTIVYTEDGSYAANLERASVDPLPKNESRGMMDDGREIPPMEEVHTPNIGSIEAVCDFLKTKPQDMIKTLIYTSPPLTAELKKSISREQIKHSGGHVKVGEPVAYQHVAVLVRGDHKVNPEKLRIVLGESAELAEPEEIKSITNAEVGFAGPINLVEQVDKMVIDPAVATIAVGVTGANKKDYHIKNVVPGRDFPLEGEDIIIEDVRFAEEGDTYKGKKLLFKKGIEVGQVFKLGTKYSNKLGAKFLDEEGNENPCLMGCYGIGINRILASAIELGNDDNGIIWPISIAPFEVIVTSVNQDDNNVAKAAENIYQQLLENNIDVLLDDRVLRGGVKFKDADLIGIPVRVTVGQKSIAEGNVEIKLRTETQSQKVPIEEAADNVIKLINSLKEKVK